MAYADTGWDGWGQTTRGVLLVEKIGAGLSTMRPSEMLVGGAGPCTTT